MAIELLPSVAAVIEEGVAKEEEVTAAAAAAANGTLPLRQLLILILGTVAAVATVEAVAATPWPTVAGQLFRLGAIEAAAAAEIGCAAEEPTRRQKLSLIHI